jgi:hypothetical protein
MDCVKYKFCNIFKLTVPLRIFMTRGMLYHYCFRMCDVLTCDDVRLWGKHLNNFKKNTNFYIVSMEFGLHIKTEKLGTSL